MNTPHAPRLDEHGRARAGSQRQLQLHVEHAPERLAAAIVSALPGEFDGCFLEWRAPLAANKFEEPVDAAFLEALGLSEHAPQGGPRWDALAVAKRGGDRVGVVLIEAKSYPEEILGPGCRATSAESRNRIGRSLDAAKAAFGADPAADWMGSCYQFANRLAHLHFLRQQGVPAWLVNVCFIGDWHRRTTRGEWQAALPNTRRMLGFGDAPIAWTADVLVDAFEQARSTPPRSGVRVAELVGVAGPPPEPLERRSYDAARLVADFPPRWSHRNKIAAYEIACPADLRASGTIGNSRWPALPLPTHIDPPSALALLESRADVYDYTPHAGLHGAVEWHVNFADPHLFVAYAGPLFAQDEMQVVEHPALGSLKQALAAERLPTRTVEDGRPTPVLITGVERRCHVATDRNAAEGRPAGLYGNAFAAADVEAVRRATTPITPPTRTNLIAIAAPRPGHGRYAADEIEYVLTTAYSGFLAAVVESAAIAPGAPVIVHTGFWGCGAFGGNRVLMAALQIVAAGMAGIDRLMFHTFDQAGLGRLEDAAEYVRDELAESAGTTVRELIEAVMVRGFEWGVSDGN
jgi:hypothetical protein